MIRNRIQPVWRILMLAFFVALAGAGAVHADDSTPVTDVGETTDTVPTNYTIYLSSPGNGTVAGIAYADEDIMRYSPNLSPQWAKTFDGTDAGLPAAADIDAYDYRWNSATFTSFHYMSFNQPASVPGLGTVDDSDVVAYTQSFLGNSWSMFFDGSQHGLTTDAEDIDSFYLNQAGDLLFSTAGNFSVPNAGGTAIAGQDEDLILWSAASQQYITALDGVNAFLVPASADVYNLESAANGGIFFAVQKPATVATIPTGAFDILLREGVSTFSLFWDASNSGFPKIDALAVIVP